MAIHRAASAPATSGSPSANGSAVTDRDRLIALQRLLLPQLLPNIGCTEAAVASEAHNDLFRLGGDWYDMIDRADRGEVMVVIGDVVGHGVEQIGVMGQLRAAANALSRVCADPMDLISVLDRVAVDLPGAEHSTALAVMLDGTGTGMVAAAGHPPPLRVRAADGVIERIDGGRRPPLTLGGAAGYGTFDYVPGDLIILYTDGVIERDDLDIDEAFERIGEVARESMDLDCAGVARRILADAGPHSNDDTVVLVIRPRHLGPAPAKPPEMAVSAAI